MYNIELTELLVMIIYMYVLYVNICMCYTYKPLY